MRLRGSLSAQLLVGLVLAEVAAVVVAMMIFPLLAPYVTYAGIAEQTVRAHLRESLRFNHDGTLEIIPTEALRHYAAARPELVFAAIEPNSGTVAKGSDPFLAEALVRIRPLYPREAGDLTTDRPGRSGDAIIVTTQATDRGPMVFASAGNAFGWDDIPSFFSTFLPAMLPIYGPLFLTAFVLVPLVVRRTLAPLHRAADAAGRIEVAALDQRLPDAGLPRELVPLVAAVNRALDRLREGFRRQRLYAANAAHELRTPIAILLARLNALPESALKSAIRLDVMRIGTMVEQLLSVARLGQQQAPMDDDIDLVALLRGVVADRAPLAIQNGRSILMQADVQAVWVKGNARSLESAVANLVDNALRAEPPGGTVETQVRGDGVLHVIDHGVGIVVEERELVFEPFWRKSEREIGSGLGLAIVKEVVLHHGGRLGIIETAGGGATFWIALDVARVQPMPKGGELTTSRETDRAKHLRS